MQTKNGSICDKPDFLSIGILPIPAQQWNTDKESNKKSKTKDGTGKVTNLGPAEDAELEKEKIKSVQETSETDGQPSEKPEENEQLPSESAEDVAIRRAGFVFLAYNTEFW